MCGIFGVATLRGRSVGLSDPDARRLRDRLAHRGPDAAGLWRSGPEGQGDHVLLAHRRLSVVDLSPAAGQPMLRAREDGSVSALVYNGELYNDAELRAELARAGYRFQTSSDTETVLAALTHWGPDALARFRGMFALAWFDARDQRLLLARDPLGIKPLYFSRPGGEEGSVVFASEVTPILAHPEVRAEPDPVGVSAYLTTIRTTLGSRTLFSGVRALEPGQTLAFALDGETLRVREPQLSRTGVPAFPSAAGLDMGATADLLARELAFSVAAHLRADVPACSLLSGGLDSSAIVACVRLARPNQADTPPTRTYSSGHDTSDPEGDPAFARLAAAHFKTVHREAPVSRELFTRRWPEMIEALGQPLSTPNEVAINEVARVLRAEGHVVALSGEGADELFAGYELPMRQASDWETSRSASIAPGVDDPGLFQLLANAWVRPADKAQILAPAFWRAAEQDAALGAWYSETFAALRRTSDDEPLAAHLRFHRRVNLVGLLGRLDTATMLEGVEGRTPFADVRIAALADSIPMSMKYRPGAGPEGTKIALRKAFAGQLPDAIVRRPKASFPLPFQGWTIDHAAALSRSPFAREIFTPAAVEHVARDPGKLWNLAWPMLNLALWGERWWGRRR